MTVRMLAAVFLTILGWSLSQTVLASTELRWLNYSPVRFFTDKDWDLAKNAAREALNNTKDGQTVEWQNPASDNRGSLTPVSTTIKDGRTCRDLAIKNYANKLEGGGTYEFCQKPDGKWGATGGPGQ
jgi:surface antigen